MTIALSFALRSKNLLFLEALPPLKVGGRASKNALPRRAWEREKGLEGAFSKGFVLKLTPMEKPPFLRGVGGIFRELRF